MSIADDWWFQRQWSDFRRGAQPVTLRWDGGSATGTLYDEGAAVTAGAVLNALPLRIPLVHVAWSGEMCMSVESYDLDVPDAENSVRLVRPGDLTWDPKFGELCVVYGTAECRLPSGPNTVVVFGSLDTGLEELAQFGRARRFEGVGDAYLEASPKVT
jgi:hypothetical protein